MQPENANKIIYLGPKGTYCEAAKDFFFKNACKKGEPRNSILEIIEELDNSPETVAVLPIENSIEGIVRETIDNLIRLKNEDIKIIAECTVEINHALVSRSKGFEGIEKVISHPQALAQCAEYLHKKFNGNIELQSASSTSIAAKAASIEGSHWAAISNLAAAKIYGLNILEEAINDEKDNKTRFVLIGTAKTNPTGNDKTSIAFSVKNKPGALFEILKIFNNHKINLTYIDSRPSRKLLGEYTFYIDFDGHIKDSTPAHAISEIQKFTNFFRIIGSFKKHE